jgi:ribonuclease P protein component
VVRNKLKRRLKEIIRGYEGNSGKDIDLLIILKKPVISLNFKILHSLIQDKLKEIENKFIK